MGYARKKQNNRIKQVFIEVQ